MGLPFVHFTLGVVLWLHKSVKSVGDASHFIGPGSMLIYIFCVCLFHLEIPVIELVPFFAHRAILHDFPKISILFGLAALAAKFGGEHGAANTEKQMPKMESSCDRMWSLVFFHFNCFARRHFNSIWTVQYSVRLWDGITFRKLLLFIKFIACAAATVAWRSFISVNSWLKTNQTIQENPK